MVSIEPSNELRLSCRGVRRSHAIQEVKIPRAAAPCLRPGQLQARVMPCLFPVPRVSGVSDDQVPLVWLYCECQVLRALANQWASSAGSQTIA